MNWLDPFPTCFFNLFFFNVPKSECQQLICEILRATPEAASADAAVQTARLASKAPSKEKRQVPLNSCSGVFDT
jgi:exocyst complex component 4